MAGEAGMIPPDIRLFTWLDVEEVVQRSVDSGNEMEWFVSASGYWDDLTLVIRPNCEANAKDWILQNFDPRVSEVNGELNIILESVNGTQRLLPVTFAEEEGEIFPAPLSPTFTRPSSIEKRSLARPSTSLDPPPVSVFHSFKGGVGRTTHALRLAVEAAEKHKVLLIDADVEAPGISWLIGRRLPDPLISFSDMIAIAHGDGSPNLEFTSKIVADRLRNQNIDGCFVLPAFRSLDKLRYLDIRPEHLIKNQSDPFFLTQLVSAIAQRLDAELVVVDLRAGYSEVAAGLLLDPRVHRVFVTTLSGQALAGTVGLLEEIGRRSPSKSDFEPYPTVVVSQVPEAIKKAGWRDEHGKLVDACIAFVSEGASDSDDPLILESGFDQNLQVTSADWDETARLVRLSNALSSSTEKIMNWLGVGRFGSAFQPSAPSDSLASRRRNLQKAAEARIFAEEQVSQQFLATAPLRALAESNTSQLPSAVISGAKGSGKTFTFLQQIRIGSWKSFVREAISRNAEVDAPITATLQSKSLGEDAQKLVQARAIEASKRLRLETPTNITDIRDVILSKTGLNLSEAQWRDVWLDCIAWRSGYSPNKTGAGIRFTKYLDDENLTLVSLFDGLEDLFQDIGQDHGQQRALRSLLQDVPIWLSQQPKRSLGLLVYVRKDLVELAVVQNSAQFLNKYKNFALQWDRIEALRLTEWISRSFFAGVNPNPETELPESKLKEELVQLWGRKLGSESSREAISADWVLNALSDFKSQIQARDLVRFIAVAAGKSISDQKWTDRLLAPSAIRGALPECSKEKITEIKREHKALERVFEKIEKIPAGKRIIPFDFPLGDLTKEDFQILEDNGALDGDSGSYYLPEIYLHGLGFKYDAPGRRRVLAKRKR